MPNSLTVQILEDGPRNVVANVVGILDTSDLSAVTLLDPATLNTDDQSSPFTQLWIEDIEWSIDDNAAVRLLWDANTDVVAMTMVARGHYCAETIRNNAGAGKTGKILITTDGWTAGEVTDFQFTLKCRKAP